MKKYLAIIFLALLWACSKEPNPNIPACSDQPPTDEDCEAYFERWFYNPQKGKCEMIAFSGCNSWGFSTQEECDQCGCD